MTSALFTKISHYITTHSLIRPHETIIIGLSGGPDSIFLLHFLNAIKHEYNLTLIAAHLDHEWRPNSAKDVLFCQQLCEKLTIPFYSKKISELPTQVKFNGSQEEVGRKYRRIFFEQLRQEVNANTIALAHHADDQLENFFIRLIRGTSLTGLSGIKSKQGYYIRPLLEVYKDEILGYLKENAIAYLEDPTNIDQIYLRNKIRLQVIPALKACDIRFEHNFLETQTRLQETEDFLEALTKKEFQRISNDNRIIIEEFLRLDPFIQNRILLSWFIQTQVKFTPSSAFFKEIVRFLGNNKSKSHKFHRFILKKDRGLLDINFLPVND